MHLIEYNEDLFSFVQSSPTSFHAIESLKKLCAASGMEELKEHERWSGLSQGIPYYIIRDSGALIAFCLGEEDTIHDGFRFLATHCDSPSLQIKPKADAASPPYTKLGVELYGGALLNPWFDRDLSVAGRVFFQNTQDELQDRLIDFSHPLLVIPSLAIHFDREANKNRTIDAQKHLPLLFSQKLAENDVQTFTTVIKEQLFRQYPDCNARHILSYDLFCYDCQRPAFFGYQKEFINSPRLDNLLSCHAAMAAVLQSGLTKSYFFYCANHEEVGSVSPVGAQGNFVESVLSRILPSGEERQISMRRSFLLSMDNAHATHPNYGEFSDPNHQVVLNGGPVIKMNANQRYASNSRSVAVGKILAKEAGVPCQDFVMRSDLACGSTVGPALAARFGIPTLDIGAPTLSMHSIREQTGSRDPYWLYQLAAKYINGHLPQYLG